MPPPKRPFTTSSLTSSLKNTIASQPLLSNLTNIDKLSSQANSLKQKAPFFGALNHHQSQNNDARSAPSGQQQQPPPSQQQQPSPASSGSGSMMRASAGQVPQQPGTSGPTNRPMVATSSVGGAPSVDMSHLTEEERVMIQSVMAKAEMADMGIPVDTSVPSSTNLPSNASQALVQQAKQHQQQQLQQQQQQMQMSQMKPANTNINTNSYQQAPFQQHAAQQHTTAMNQLNQQSQQNTLPQQQSTNMIMNNMNENNLQNQQTSSNMMNNLAFNQMNTEQQNYPNQQAISLMSQQQQPQQHHQEQVHQQKLGDLRQISSIDGTTQSVLDAKRNELPLLEQQTQHLVSQINSQFNLGQGQTQGVQVHNVGQQQQQANLQLMGRQQQPFRNDSSNQFQSMAQQPMQMPQQSGHNQTSMNQSDNRNLMMESIPPSDQQQQLQQYQQCDQMNPMLGDQARLYQARAGTFNQPQSQQQYNQNSNLQQMFSYQPNQQQNLANQQQMDPNRVGQLDSSNDIVIGQNFMAPQQPQQLTQGVGNLMGQNINNLGIQQQGNQQMMGQQNPFQTQQAQFSPRSFTDDMATGYDQGYSREPSSYDARRDIRFKSKQIISSDNEHALSDQEYQGSSRSNRRHNKSPSQSRPRRLGPDNTSQRRSHTSDRQQESVESRERELQAYDLAQRTSPGVRGHVKSRKLPQPGGWGHQQVTDRSLQSSVEQLHEDGRSNRSRDGNKSPSKSTSKPKKLNSGRYEVSKQDNSQYFSDSDAEGEFIDEKKHLAQRENDSSPGSPTTSKLDQDKGDKALQLLSELKLTEQANQVMEQQQLLIKQSQELIKLQLEQQALSQEIKKSLQQKPNEPKTQHNQQDDVKTEQNCEKKQQSSQNDDMKNDNDDPNTIKQEKESSNTQSILSSTQQTDSKKVNEIQQISRNSALGNKKKSTSFNDQDSDFDELQRAPSKATSTRSGAFTTNTIDDNVGSDADPRTAGKHSDKIKKTTTLASTSNLSHTPTTASPRYNRDLLLSPTDTTDSDIELVSQHSNLTQRRQRQLLSSNHQYAPSKPKGVMRRREPTGLPPSPLPVAAAIQLHHLQQQHFKHQINPSVGNRTQNNRTNFLLRSRSVTNSPNHLLERNNSGYITDGQRIRPTSPDTLSEYGGQRRRKRLPEPPSNAVPITPSIVRKMVLAQRAAATNSSSGKLLTSINAQSTLLTNTHTGRTTFASDEDNYPKSSYASEYLSNSSDQAGPRHPTSTLSNTPSGRYPTTNQPRQVGTNEQLLAPNQTRPLGGIAPTQVSRNSDLGKFLSSTFGNSILRNSNISDIKETPELDKLISNLDDYYGFDNNKRQSRVPPASNPLNTLDIPLRSHPDTTLARSISPTSHFVNHSTNFAPTVTGPTFNFPRSSLYSGISASLYRRNSEGESNLASRLTRPTYRQAALDDFKTYGQNFGASSTLTTNLGSTGSSPNRHLRWRDHQIPSTTALTTSDQWLNHRPGHNDRQVFSQSYRSPQHQAYVGASTQSRLPLCMGTSFDSATENLDYPRSLQQNWSGEGGNSTMQQRNALLGSQSTSRHIKYPGPSELGRHGIANQQLPSRTNFANYQHPSLDLDSRRSAYSINPRTNSALYEPRTSELRADKYFRPSVDSIASHPDSYNTHFNSKRHQYQRHEPGISSSRAGPTVSSGQYSSFAPFTKDDIINNGPKFNSIGYRFRTENQNKYVTESRTAIESIQSRYPYPYKRILLSKNPKDRIGNGIGVRITGGQPIPNVYDKVNRCIVTSGAFVNEVFQTSNVYFMDEIHEGDQIIEWNGVNLCNRSDEEVQQILLSQFSDDEVEIIYLNREKFHEAYISEPKQHDSYNDNYPTDSFDTFAALNKPSGQHHQSGTGIETGGVGRYTNEISKGSIRRKLSFSSIANMWSK